MVNLKDLGVSLHYFAPLPNSIIVGRFKMGEIDLESARTLAKSVFDAFEAQGVNNQVIFLPTAISLQRMSMSELATIRDQIDSFMKAGAQNDGMR